MSSITFSRIPGGIGSVFRAHGTCSCTGIFTGKKYSSRNLPFSVSSHANPHSFTRSTCATNSLSSGHKNSFVSNPSSSILACVNQTPGKNVGGCGEIYGSVLSGSSGNCRIIQIFVGIVPGTGQTLFAIFLYTRHCVMPL